MFNYYLAQCNSVNILPLLGEHEHFISLPLSTCCCQTFTFEQNPFILFVQISRLSFRHSCVHFIQMTKYLAAMPALHTTHHLQAALRNCKWEVTRAKTLARDNHRTSVWNYKTLWAAPFSSHKDANIYDFSRVVTLQRLSCAHHATQELGLT